MAGKARMRFIARSNRLRFERDSGHYAGANLYGVECIYCHEYFPNVKKPEFGGYVCRSCKYWVIAVMWALPVIQSSSK